MGVIERIVSGGQTGVDRAALDAARAAGIAIGGWCPEGRRAEDGVIPERYPLRETPTPDYALRTAWNVRDSDATLILAWGRPAGGTERTRQEAETWGRPCLVCDLERPPEIEDVAAWIRSVRPAVLNVAGPRASEVPEAYTGAKTFLERLFAELVRA